MRGRAFSVIAMAYAAALVAAAITVAVVPSESPLVGSDPRYLGSNAVALLDELDALEYDRVRDRLHHGGEHGGHRTGIEPGVA